jgi:hypothetical protein
MVGKKNNSPIDPMELERYLAAMRQSGRFTDHQILRLRQKIIDRSLGKPEMPDNITLPSKRKVNSKELAKYLNAMRQKTNIVNFPTGVPDIKNKPYSDVEI